MLYTKGVVYSVPQLIHADIKNVSSGLIYQNCAILNIALKDFFDDPLFDDLDD